MLKTLISTAVAGAFAALIAMPAAADDKAQTSATPAGRTSAGAALFERLDKNKDGFVSRDEARDATELQGRFAELDTDNDGKLSAVEMRALDSGRSSTGTTASGQKGGLSK